MKQTKSNRARTAATTRYYSRLSPAQLEAIAAPFDRGEYGASGLTAADKRLLRLAEERGRKRGRPAVGKGAEKIRVSMERGLLSRADAFAKKHGLNRSQLIAQSLERQLKSA